MASTSSPATGNTAPPPPPHATATTTTATSTPTNPFAQPHGTTSNLWSTVFAKKEYHALFEQDELVIDTIFTDSLLVNTGNNGSICQFLRAQLPQGIPHAFLSVDSSGKPMVLINPSVPKSYFASKSGGPFPQFYVITDDENSSDMSVIHHAKVTQLFKKEKHIILEVEMRI